MLNIDLNAMSTNELEKLAHAIAGELQKREQQEKRRVTAQIKELAKSAGITVSIAEGAQKSGNARPKYQHPDDPVKTSTGRGKRPGWLTELLARGRTLEELKISP